MNKSVAIIGIFLIVSSFGFLLVKYLFLYYIALSSPPDFGEDIVKEMLAKEVSEEQAIKLAKWTGIIERLPWATLVFGVGMYMTSFITRNKAKMEAP